jgi:glycosyltransferase involved in cell wall biosynthesis
MAALSTLFATTRLVVTRHPGEVPGGLQKIEGKDLDGVALKGPRGRGIGRKLLLPFWLARNGTELIREILAADVVHSVVPGDIGVLGLGLARLLRKPVLVRHCGTWGNRSTAAYRYLASTLPRLAQHRRIPTVILATGGPDADQALSGARPTGDQVCGAPGVHWIFSTSLSRDQLNSMPKAPIWRPGRTLELVFVGRLTAAKNAIALVEALPRILEAYPDTRLTLLGHGPDKDRIVERISNLGLNSFVDLPGNVSRAEVLEHLVRSSLMVFPTRVAEGFPKAVFEALACGVPVLAPAVSVLPSLLDNRAGKILTGVDSQSIAQDVVECIADPDFFEQTSQQAILVAADYSLERWAEEIGRHLCNAMELAGDNVELSGECHVQPALENRGPG